MAVSEPLRALLLAAWEEGFAAQQKEIAGLKRSITAISDLEGRLEGDEFENLNLFEELKKTSDIIDAEEKELNQESLEAMTLSQRIFTFFRNLEPKEAMQTMENPEEESPTAFYSAQLKLLRDHQVRGMIVMMVIIFHSVQLTLLRDHQVRGARRYHRVARYALPS